MTFEAKFLLTAGALGAGLVALVYWHISTMSY